jgi:hypothetical protein
MAEAAEPKDDITTEEAQSGDSAKKHDRSVMVSSFERSVFKEFFTVVDNDGKNLRLHCKVCPPASKKTFSTAINSTANLKKHLKVVIMLLRWICFSRFELTNYFWFNNWDSLRTPSVHAWAWIDEYLKIKNGSVYSKIEGPNSRLLTIL